MSNLGQMALFAYLAGVIARQSCASRCSKMGSAVVFRAFWVKNFYGIIFLVFFLDKISVLLVRSETRDAVFSQN